MNFTTFTRREVCLGLTGLAAGASFHSRVSAQAAPSTDRRIDVHHHFFAPTPAASRYVEEAATPDAIAQWTPARSLAAMGEAGIDKAFLSSPLPFGDDRVGRRRDARIAARETNEYGARVRSDGGGRFGLFAVLPLPDVEASLREIEYGFDTLKADGVGLVTSYGDRWLGDRAFESVFDELNRRKAVVYTHPVDAPCCRNLVPDTSSLTVEWPTNTSRAIYSLVNDGSMPGTAGTFSSRATRYADVRFVWSHAGGALLGVFSRMLGAEIASLSGSPARDSKLYHLRRWYYDTATVANTVQMQALKRLVGGSQILLGTDFPFVPMQATLLGLQASGFSREELQGIYAGNALRLLPDAP